MLFRSPIFHSSFEGELGFALESLQGKRDLIYACVQDLKFLSRGDRDLGVAFQSHLRSQAWYRGVAKDSILLSSPYGFLLEPTEWPKGSPVEFGDRPRDCSPGHAEREGRHLTIIGASRGFS